MNYTYSFQERLKQRDDLNSDIIELRNNLNKSMLLISTSSIAASVGRVNTTSTKTRFATYAEKMKQYAINETDEIIEWNLLTAKEFVSSIQATTGKLNLMKNIMLNFKLIIACGALDIYYI